MEIIKEKMTNNWVLLRGKESRILLKERTRQTEKLDCIENNNNWERLRVSNERFKMSFYVFILPTSFYEPIVAWAVS